MRDTSYFSNLLSGVKVDSTADQSSGQPGVQNTGPSGGRRSKSSSLSPEKSSDPNSPQVSKLILENSNANFVCHLHDMMCRNPLKIQELIESLFDGIIIF